MNQFDVAIIGGGIVGLATGYHLLQQFPQTRVVILEKEAELAFHQTGRNSGVLHSGIYYRPGSLRALNCRSGNRTMAGQKTPGPFSFSPTALGKMSNYRRHATLEYSGRRDQNRAWLRLGLVEFDQLFLFELQTSRGDCSHGDEIHRLFALQKSAKSPRDITGGQEG